LIDGRFYKRARNCFTIAIAFAIIGNILSVF
jgi:hypothetical protein